MKNKSPALQTYLGDRYHSELKSRIKQFSEVHKSFKKPLSSKIRRNSAGEVAGTSSLADCFFWVF